MNEEGPNPWIVAGVVMLGLVMSIIDQSIVNVALPHMMGTLGADVSQVSWVATGYMLANVIVIPLSAWLASLFGRTRMYGWAVVVFTLASVACGMAPNLFLLVVARVIQGLAAGVMMPTGQSILYESFPPEKRGMSMAFFGLGIMVGPAIGPTLGGWITDNYGWPWIFYINLPVGILASVLIPAVLRDPPYLKRRQSGGDLVGIALLALGIGSLQYVLERGEDAGWFDADWVVMTMVTGVLLLVGFVIWELEHPDPAVDLGVFRDPTFRTATLVGACVGVGLSGGMFVLPMFMQSMMGLSATQSGLALVPGALATAAMMPVTGALTRRVDARILVATGMIIFGLGMAWMSTLDARAGIGDLFWPQVLRGAGMGLTFVPLSTASIGSMPKERIAQATGLYNLTRQLGGSIGIAWLASLLQHDRGVHAAYLSERVEPYADVARLTVGSTQAGLLGAYGRVARASTELAFRDLFQTIVILFAVSLPLLVFLRPPKAGAGGGGPQVAHAD